MTHRPHRPHRNATSSQQLDVVFKIMLLAVFLAALLPLDLDDTLANLQWRSSFVSVFQALPWRLYLMLKAAILWVPLGFLAGFISPQISRLHVPVLFGGICLMAAMLLMHPQLLFRDVLELLALLPGLAAGYWLGKRTRLPGEMEAYEPQRIAKGKLYPGKSEAKIAWPEEKLQGAEDTAMPSPVLLDGLLSAETPIRPPESAATTLSNEDMSRSTRRAHRGRHGKRQSDSMITVMAFAIRAMGLLLLGIALVLLMDFPRWPFAIGMALMFYMAVLWLWPQMLFVVVPASLPLLDLAPWTGRFFIDEFDLLMLASAGILLLRGRLGKVEPMAPLNWLLIALFMISVLLSLIQGLIPIQPLDANTTASYWSSYNSLRVVKGLIWGVLFFYFVRRTPLGRQKMSWHLSLGMGLGLLGVGLVGAWEHGLFVGFEGGHEAYRIVSTFSSMHTGGGHIEAYLVAALPFLWLATPKLRNLALTGPLMALTAYVMVYTVARGGVLALGVVIVILFVASLRLALRSHGRRYAAPISMLVVMGLVLVAGIGGGYFQQRFTETSRDWQTRVDHWAQALDMVDHSLGAQIFGMGLGSFPRYYQERGPVDRQPASFGFANDRGNTYFRLATGETVYYAQRIPFSAGRRYTLELDLRSRQGDTRLDTPVCEKQLLNSRQCEWFSFAVPGDGAWHRQSHVFSSTKVGAQDWLHRPPVELFLYHPGKGGVVDVDNIRLLDPEGRDVLCNGDFSQGGDCWFFKTHSHLPWHIKNVWIHVLFEQGWVGLLLFSVVTIVAIYRLAKAGWRGHRLPWALLASLAGLLTVGTFDSLLDAPRLATLLMAWMWLGVGHDWDSRPVLQAPARRDPDRSARHAGS